MYNFNIENKLLNLHELLQSIGDDRVDLIVVCVDVLLKVSSILVVFCQNLFDHRTSEGLISCCATLLSCLSDAGIASHFIPGVEMRTEVVSTFHAFTFVDTGYAQPGLGSTPIRGMRSHPLHLAENVKSLHLSRKCTRWATRCITRFWHSGQDLTNSTTFFVKFGHQKLDIILAWVAFLPA